MDLLDEEILGLWRSFHNQKLRYLMVGGFAVNLHGFMRTTGDMDIWIENTPENRARLRRSLREMGIGDFPSLETMDFVPGWSGIRLASGIELDVMTYLKGFPEEAFSDCLHKASVATITEIPVPFLHLNHLLEEKTKTNRPKDQIDVLALEEIKRLRAEG